MIDESKKRLIEYIENDKIYQDYKSNDKEPSDFERFCFVHCRDIENVLNELKELKEQLETVETYRCFNMGNDIRIVSLLKGDYVRNRFEYETIEKYKSVLDEIRELLNETFVYGDEWHWDSGVIRDYLEDIEKLLDKVKE